MPRHSKLARSKSIHNAHPFIASFSNFAFLNPGISPLTTSKPLNGRQYSATTCPKPQTYATTEVFFFSALTQVSSCKSCRLSNRSGLAGKSPPPYSQRAFLTSQTTSPLRANDSHSSASIRNHRSNSKPDQDEFNRIESKTRDTLSNSVGGSHKLKGSPHARTLRWLEDGHETSSNTVNSWFPSKFFDNTFERRFAESSKLPPDFFGDVNALKDVAAKDMSRDGRLHSQDGESNLEGLASVANLQKDGVEVSAGDADALEERLKLLKSVRELEVKLATARKQLKQPIESNRRPLDTDASIVAGDQRQPVVLSKEDYMNLVDLYYYSYNTRFSPESTDLSPTPTFVDDHSFELSGNFFLADSHQLNEDEHYESPLKLVHDALKSRKLKEVAAMQIFVDLLLDDHSSNRALYEAYKGLPQPGVAYLPTGVIRLFMQRMSTPWTHSEKSMLRYLALIDEMQREKIPMTRSEWSSAVYLAGRSFARVTEADVASSFRIWQQMEHEAGVTSSHVTFNILFDIAVRAGKFALAQIILKEMSKRNLRLNRLGRVSLIYYHGLRGDGDGVRKSYRDFVEAGEIVDTLVLNCVIAALINAKEPTAAEQVYERMKSMYSRLRKEVKDDGSEAYYMRYPPPGDSTIGREMASNHLGRILLHAPRMRIRLPEHHHDLQTLMPLMPDFTTFRSMLAHHATTGGDLDRMTVLLRDMTDTFGMPLRTLVFQLLFKGFALHGPIGGPDSAWSVKRLDLCWKAFRDAVKETQSEKTSLGAGSDSKFQPVLPTITQVNAIPATAPIPSFSPALNNPPPQRRLSSWNEFVLDLAIFPEERLRRIERFHAQMFDDENLPKPHESKRPHTFVSPFFQSTVYQAPEPKLDHEEGEYVLPSPTGTAILRPSLNGRWEPLTEPFEDGTGDTQANLQPFHGEEDPSDLQALARRTHDQLHQQRRTQVTPTRPLICWLLRAYARNTKSRAKVEEIWGTVRRMWQPLDAIERESVVRVLRRCLRDCDREGRG